MRFWWQIFSFQRKKLEYKLLRNWKGNHVNTIFKYWAKSRICFVFLTRFAKLWQIRDASSIRTFLFSNLTFSMDFLLIDDTWSNVFPVNTTLKIEIAHAHRWFTQVNTWQKPVLKTLFDPPFRYSNCSFSCLLKISWKGAAKEKCLGRSILFRRLQIRLYFGTSIDEPLWQTGIPALFRCEWW